MEEIYLPVSLGEAIDKLTILDIKINKIKDNRKIDVEKEYNLLYDKLTFFLLKYNDLYQSMKKINLLIWDMMDILRDGECTSNMYLKKCKECIEFNDVRFRIKNKINYISNSSLKEQKSYKINRLVIKIHNNMQNITRFIRPIQYYSFMYDEIVIVNNNIILKEALQNDPTIIFTHDVNNYEYKNIFLFEEDIICENMLTIFKLNDDLLNSIL
jgi:hypothetical protein